ncbi:HAMP domain-containing protein [Vibrio sp. V27_P1S3P104]|uniref:methyl-accepting chemotaxis protein n=1 Tax=unclassified Vibrio TaxID=2614977 RepID=UPI00137280D8|nr:MULTISPECIES: methyl-accepting chemotaxis protein [unclassified Vibrio]NAW69476.1 HAMP domain-containing protein [Vibrio sp. V28_P6S34P95]NAX06426.1 HAMP domain-containing protein [Vibrio sp. V30_P3S12P165]NAX34694.1 HAMP domain-containing protein [Vibrio sp. V29_P1S30P107]NAX38954.1 HAMP domain-containing protein [Vibrio sp. V27_P1S3P104]NAX41206.1 HAMP domain-containing protein [Vibrio sp. V26_P1S5P106]
MFKKLRMTSRLIMVFSLPLTLCLLLAAWIVTNQVSSRVVSLGETSVSQTSQSSADMVSSWVEARMAVVRSLAQTETLASGDTQAIFNYVKHFGKKMSPEFEVMFFVDLKGDAYHHNGVIASRANRAYFQQLVVQKTQSSLVSDPLYSGTSGNAIIVLAQAVKNHQGEVIGLLAATVTLNTLTELVDNVSTDNAVAWLVDSRGIYVAHPTESKRLKDKATESGDAAYAQMSKQMVAGQTGITDLYLENNQHYMVAYHPVANTPGWSLAVAQPYDAIMSTAHELTVSLLLAFVVTIIVLIGIVLLVAKMIVKPVNETRQALEQIAAGDGDLTQRLNEDRYDEFGDLARSFNAFVGGVHSLVKQVAEASIQLGAAAEELAVSSREANDQVQQQRHETDQVATAMTEMATTVNQVAENAANAAQAAEQSSRFTQEGEAVVTNTTNEVLVLSKEVQTAVEVIGKLQQDADSIGKVLEVIRSIAEQTNLLALNAAIEAARAGEHGRGFAVVADEVRTLATRTQSSTEEIRDIIEKLQTASKEASHVMDGSYRKANEVVQWAEEASEKLRDITKGIFTINDMNIQIATATEQQSIVADDVNETLNRISSGVEQLSNGSTHIAAASDELARLATDLQTRVGRFKV